MTSTIDRLDDLNRRAELGGGEARVKRQHDAGKFTARERIELLVELFGGAGQGTLHAADRPVGVDGEHVADPAVE